MKVKAGIGRELPQHIVDEVVRRVLTVAKPDKIILFGSATTGTMTRDSDVDLLVVGRDPGSRSEESVRIGDTLRGLGHSFHVIVITTERFESFKDIIGGISYSANKYWKVIYDAA